MSPFMREVVLIVQMRTLRPSEVRWLAPSHSASKGVHPELEPRSVSKFFKRSEKENW